MEITKIKVIGLGGIGSIFTDKLCRFMTFGKFSNSKLSITLIDGDAYENKNKERQDFIFIKNKATSKRDELNSKFGNKTIISIVDEYISANNVSSHICEGDLVFLCVDNHQSRKLVSDHAGKLNNIIVVSAGNDYVDGNVQVYARENGVDISPSITKYHPEITNPVDKHPADMSCGELAESTPQLYFANLGAATIMCWVLYALTQDKFDFTKSEIYFDITLMSVISKSRSL